MNQDAFNIQGVVQSSENNRPIVLKEHLVPQNDLSDAGFRMLNHIRSEAKTVTAQQNTHEQPTYIDREKLEVHQREYRHSLAGLLADSLKSLAFCERQAANNNDGSHQEPTPNHSKGNETEGEGLQPTSENGVHDQNISDTLNESKSSESTTEPFPDYFESCETDPPVENIQQEQAYNYAISKVVEEVIRFREVDTRIATFPSFAPRRSFDSSQHTQLEAIAEDQEYEDNANNEQKPDNNSTRIHAPNEPHENRTSNTRLFIDRRESDKLRVIEEMRSLLTNSNLRDYPKDCFYDLSNMVIRLEVVLFRSENVSPQEFLSAEDTYEIRLIASSITRYLSVVDNRLKDLLFVATRVHYILGDVFRDTSVNAFIRYRRIVHVVFGNQLVRATDTEKHLLTTFFDLYDTFVYTSFLNMRNRQLLLEEIIDIGRDEITRLLVALWDILCRVIENYDRYLHIMNRIGTEYMGPVIDEVDRISVPYQGTRWEEQLKTQLEEGLDRYSEADLSVLRPEGI